MVYDAGLGAFPKDVVEESEFFAVSSSVKKPVQ